jgi:hypothetical protein
MSINSKGRAIGSTYLFLFCEWVVVQRVASIGGVPNVPKKFGDGPINMAPSVYNKNFLKYRHFQSPGHINWNLTK